MGSRGRPEIFLNAAISLDGKLATKTGDSTLSSLEDWRKVHLLRNTYQAILVGKNTIIKDNPKLVVKVNYLPAGTVVHNPVRIVVDSNASISPSSACISYMPEIKTIIAVSLSSNKTNISNLQKAGAIIFQAGKKRVDLKALMKFLYENHSIENILVEGGGELIWSLFEERLLDKFRLYIAPKIAGGNNSISLVRGIGYEIFANSPTIEYTSINRCGPGIEIEGIIIKYT